MPAYRILSLDGGGIRGVFTATLLERLEHERPGLIKGFNLFSGTSTGGILALGLAFGLSPTEAKDLYRLNGKKVFADNIFDDFFDVGRLIGAEYNARSLKSLLKSTFGDAKLGDLKKKVVISSFDLDNESTDPQKPRTWKPKFFHNYGGADSDAKELVMDVALRTSAAPTYFPSYQGYVDGGVVANNPCMCALAAALDRRAGRQKLENVVMLSVGTGKNHMFLESRRDLDWGYSQWVKPILSLMLDGVGDVASFQCGQVLDEQFHRLEPPLPEPIDLDAVDKIEDLVTLAHGVNLGPTLRWLDKHVLN